MKLRHQKKQCLDDIKNEYHRLGSIFRKKVFTEETAIERVKQIMSRIEKNEEDQELHDDDGDRIFAECLSIFQSNKLNKA